MHEYRKAQVTSPIVRLGEDASRIMPLAGIVGAAALGGAAAWCMLGGGGLQRFSYAYLVSYLFFLSIILGSLFFVMIQHLARAGWSVTVRRVAEIIAAGVVPMAILFLPILIPILLGYDKLYAWNNAGTDYTWAVGDSEIFKLKTLYLNSGFFALRSVIYFALWVTMAVCLLRWSLRQDDTGDKKLTLKMQTFCAPMMILFAMTLVFSSFDMEMSLAPMWFSTMFPVYFFAGAVLSSLATITLVSLLLQRSGRVTDEITVEHYHDLAKLTYAFIVFWGYIAFSQFMLIWYANLPEETFWFKYRSESGWATVSMLLLFGHLLIPLLGLMARTVRRSKSFLVFSSVYLLAMHWVDHYWLIMPQLNATIQPTISSVSPVFGLPEILAFVGMTGLFVASFCLIAGNRSLVPLKDPRLSEALNYENL